MNEAQLDQITKILKNLSDQDEIQFKINTLLLESIDNLQEQIRALQTREENDND